MATHPSGEMLSILSVQSCVDEDVQPAFVQGSPVVCDVGSVATSSACASASCGVAAVSSGGVGGDVGSKAVQVEVEENVVGASTQGDVSVPSTMADTSAMYSPPLCPIAVDSSFKYDMALEKHGGVENTSGVKVCSHCGAAADSVKAKKCSKCHRFFMEHWKKRSLHVASPCSKSRYGNSKYNKAPHESTEAVTLGSVDPKTPLKGGDSSGSDFGGSTSKDSSAGESESGEEECAVPSLSVPLTSVAPEGPGGSVSAAHEQVTFAITRSGKLYKQTDTPSEQLSIAGGSTDASSTCTSVASIVSSLVPATFVSCFPMLQTTTTTVGAALLNISNSSLTGGALEDCFVSSYHPVAVIEVSGTGPQRHAPPTSAGAEPCIPLSAKPSPLPSQLPVMIGMAATIGDALNLVMTRSSPHGSPPPVLVPASLAVSTAAVPCLQPAVSVEPPHLVASGGVSLPDNRSQRETTSVTNPVGSGSGPAHVITLSAHSLNETIAASPTSGLAPPTSGLAPPTSGLAPLTSDVAPPTSGLVPPTSDTAPPTSDLAPPTRAQGVVTSNDGAPSEASSPAKTPDTCATSLPDPAETTGGKATPSSMPPPLYKDGGSPAPSQSEVVGGGGGGVGRGLESSQFFSAKFRNRYSHLEKSEMGKGLKRASNIDNSSSAIKKIKGADPPPVGSPDLIGMPLAQVAQQPGALIRTEVLTTPTMPPPPRQVVAPITTQFQRQGATSKPNIGGVTYQRVGSGHTPTQGGVSMSAGKVPIRPADTAVRPTPIRPASNLPMSPLQQLHMSLHQSSQGSLLTSNVSSTHGIHTTTPTSGLLPMPPLVKTSSVAVAPPQSTSSLTCTSSLLYTNNIIQNVLLRPTLASTAVMGSVTAQLLKPQGEAKPGTTVVRVLSPTPSLSTGQQPVRNKVSATTVFPTIAMTTSLAPLPTTVKSTSVESKSAILSQSGRDHAATGGGTSARTSPPLVPPGPRAKVVYTSTITGPRSSPGAVDGMDSLSGKVMLASKVPLTVATPPASVELQKLTCVIQSRIRQALDKEPDSALVEQQKGLGSPTSPPSPPPLPSLSHLHTPHNSQLPSKGTESSCMTTWVPPLGCPPLVGTPVVPTVASDKVAQTLPATLDRGLQLEKVAVGQSSSDRAATAERLAPNPTERPVSTANVGTFTERSIGTSTERSIGTSTERSVGTSTERSIGTSMERSVGTSTERSVATCTERSYERGGVPPLERTTQAAAGDRVVTSTSERTSAAVERSAYSSTPAATANSLQVKEEYRTGVNGVAVDRECEFEKNGEKYSKLRSDEALESGSEDNSENGNANSGSRKLRDVGGRGRRDRGRGEDNFTQGNEEEDRDNGNNNTEEDQKDDLDDGDTLVFSVKLKDCFMHHVMWNNFKMVFLVPQLNGSRPASSEPPVVKCEEDAKSEEGHGRKSEEGHGRKKTRKQERVVPHGEEEEEEEEEEEDMECGDSKEASPTSSQSGVPVSPCFSVYELRTKLFSSFSPSAVYVYTYKNNIRSYKPPIHWVYVMKRMGGVQDTCHTCRLLAMHHVRNICDYYRIKLPSILDTLGRNEIPPGRKVIDLSHVRPEDWDQEYLDLIPSCAFVDTPSKSLSKLPRKRGRKPQVYVQGEPSPPPMSEQSESVDNSLDQCDGGDDNSPSYRYQSMGKKKPCPQCGTNILKKCKKCPLCGKTFGLFAFGRRQCTSCGRVNLAKYTSCNKCGATLQNAPIAYPKDEETRDSPQPASEYVCKRRRLHNLPLTYSSHNHDDGETPLGGPRLSRHTSTASDEEMVDYGEEFDEEEDCPDDSEMSSAKSPMKSRHTGYQYGRVPWANAEVAVLVDEKGVLRFCLHELCTRVLTEHSKSDVFDMVKDLNLPVEQGDVSLLKKLQALGMHSNRSPICRLIVAEDLWALLDALQEPVPDEVHQHLETVTVTTSLNNSYSSPPAPPPVSRPSQLPVCQSPEALRTPIAPVQDSPALVLNPGTTPVIAEDDNGFESTLHELQCSDGQFVSILRSWNGGQYVCLPEVWRKYFPEVNRNNLTGVLKKLELDTHLPTGQQATLLRSAGVISLRGAPGRLMKLEDMQALLDSFGIPLQIGTGKQAVTPAKQAANQTTPKPRPTSIVPKPIARVCDERPTPVQKDGPPHNIDSRLAQCMQHVLIALGSENVGKLLTDSAQSAFEASALAEQDAGGVDAELNGVEQLIATRRELCLVLNKEIGYLRATSQGYMAEIVRLNNVQKQAFQDVEDQLASMGVLLSSENS